MVVSSPCLRASTARQAWMWWFLQGHLVHTPLQQQDAEAAAMLRQQSQHSLSHTPTITSGFCSSAGYETACTDLLQEPDVIRGLIHLGKLFIPCNCKHAYQPPFGAKIKSSVKWSQLLSPQGKEGIIRWKVFPRKGHSNIANQSPTPIPPEKRGKTLGYV